MNMEGLFLFLLEKLFDTKLIIFGKEMSIGYLAIGIWLIRYHYIKLENRITQNILDRLQ
ncbi:Uncharacterised protein [Bacillus subtilis]|nr:hypothetical protein NRS6185_04128 [Bacillus subtilis]SPY14899.1 Uncharacterised protein [Bacillus subtilis]